ncbi:EG45-like domain containing protein [Alnus glutinosa]|uniref:EG45-like domain containing protein n=1 Tax=Alnus glutinosa TaxID=3517 RepID=UPI002D799BAF|nr:EG45-like domain containing protein [Alnus glutinosa]
MGINAQVLITFGTIICFASTSYTYQGTASFYKPPYFPSACNGYRDDGIFIAGASDALWKNGAACGKDYLVYCTGATNQAPQPCTSNDVVVRIVDYCPKGCRGTINLSEDAFSMIANLSAGVIKVDYAEYYRKWP